MTSLEGAPWRIVMAVGCLRTAHAHKPTRPGLGKRASNQRPATGSRVVRRTAAYGANVFARYELTTTVIELSGIRMAASRGCMWPVMARETATTL